MLGLRDEGRIQPGQKVLINGASEGVGTFAVQIARAFGTEVTAVCSTRNVHLVRSIGADEIIDYTTEDFTRNGQRDDLLLDIAGSPLGVGMPAGVDTHGDLRRRRAGWPMAATGWPRVLVARGVAVSSNNAEQGGQTLIPSGGSPGSAGRFALPQTVQE